MVGGLEKEKMGIQNSYYDFYFFSLFEYGP